MKKLLILLLFPISGWTQDTTIRFNDNTQDVSARIIQPIVMKPAKEKTWYYPFISKSDIVLYSLQLVSGAASGFGDALVYHPHTIERIFNGANLNWWIPSRSQGKGGWVMTRDGIHMVRGFEHLANYTSIGVAALSFSDFKGLSKGQCLLLAAKKVVISSALNRAAFIFTYRIVFNDNPERIKAGLDPH